MHLAHLKKSLNQLSYRMLIPLLLNSVELCHSVTAKINHFYVAAFDYSKHCKCIFHIMFR